jgi:hypothetical protein
LLGACTAQPSGELDGSVAYSTSSLLGSSTALQLAVNGYASLHIEREGGSPQDFTGSASAAALAALRDDIAAADLPSLPGEYHCADFAPCDAPEPSREVVAKADGATTPISVDARISNAELPAGLVKVFQDLDDITTQLCCAIYPL